MFILIIASLLVIGTVLLHAVGFSVILRSLVKARGEHPTETGPVTWLLVRTTLLLILIHYAEISLWAGAYFWIGCIPDLDSAFYFSGVTYTTIGYGDVVLPESWQFLGPVEGLMGILMCGLSTGLFFAVICRIFLFRNETEEQLELQAQGTK